MFGTLENHSRDGGRHKNEGMMRIRSSSALYCKLLHRDHRAPTHSGEDDTEVQEILDPELDS